MKKISFAFVLLCAVDSLSAVHVNGVYSSTGISAYSMNAIEYKDSSGQFQSIAHPESCVAPHVMFGIQHTWDDIFSGITGHKGGAFSLAAEFYGAFKKQGFKGSLVNQTTGAQNLMVKQDLVDTRLYFSTRYRMYHYNTMQLWLAAGLGVAFNLLNRFTWYESSTNANTGASLRTHPWIFTPRLSLEFQHCLGNNYFVTALYAFSHARTRYHSLVHIEPADPAASAFYQNLYQINAAAIVNVQTPPSITVHNHVLSVGLSKQF